MFIDSVRRTIERFHLLSRGDRVILGVSGGPDSMVLLGILDLLRREYDLSLIVAHVNHGFRPEESKREAELVEKESNRLGLPFEYGEFQVKEFAKDSGFSPQDAARRIRFHFLRNLLHKHQAQKIALGQNADDQVETVLIRLFRGSGLKGLKGMLPIRQGSVIRPLLETWRNEIESYAVEHRIPYLTDSSNLKKDYLRNRIRLDLIPLIQSVFQSSVKERILKTSAFLREEDDYLEKQSEEADRALVQDRMDSLSFHFRDFRTLHPAIQWRLIRRLLDRVDPKTIPEERAWDAAGALCRKFGSKSSGFSMQVSPGVIVEKRYDEVSIRKGEIHSIPPFETELIIPGMTWVEEIGVKIAAEEINDRIERGGWGQSPETVFLDYDKLQVPLRIRNFRPGDRFRPLGLKGTQKLKEFFIDHKIPKIERPGILLLVSGETIVWVIGHRISEEANITENTKKVLKLSVKPSVG